LCIARAIKGSKNLLECDCGISKGGLDARRSITPSSHKDPFDQKEPWVHKCMETYNGMLSMM